MQTPAARLAVRKYQQSHPWIRSLFAIRLRCNNKRSISYGHYGARGIKCLITLNEIEFLWHRDYAANMQRPTIDRIDNDGHYFLENCRFLENSENIRRGNGKPYKTACVVCGKCLVFESNRDQKYCSKKCSIEYWKRLLRERTRQKNISKVGLN